MYLKSFLNYPILLNLMDIQVHLLEEDQDLMLQYAPKRSIIKNTNNGYAYLTCLVLDKNYRVLQVWDKLLQCG